MKITKAQLKKLIKEELREGNHSEEKSRRDRVGELNIRIGDIIEAETPEERDSLQNELVEYILSLEDKLQRLKIK
jgi:hypothetical protein